MQRSETSSTHDDGLGVVCFTASPVGVDVHECIQFGIQSFDFRKVGFDQFNWRNFSLANLLRHDRGGEEGEITHAIESVGQKAESSMSCGIQKRQSLWTHRDAKVLRSFSSCYFVPFVVCGLLATIARSNLRFSLVVNARNDPFARDPS